METAYDKKFDETALEVLRQLTEDGRVDRKDYKINQPKVENKSV